MTSSTRPCPACGRTMEIGFLLDRAHNALARQTWFEGTPVRSFLFGIRVRGLRHHTVLAYRCVGCGLLQFYTEDPPPGS